MATNFRLCLIDFQMLFGVYWKRLYILKLSLDLFELRSEDRRKKWRVRCLNRTSSSSNKRSIENLPLGDENDGAPLCVL